MFSIQTNVNSLVAQQNLNVNNIFQSKTIQQLTSGYRINSSGDDAAGLAVANKFRSSVAELAQGVANGNDAVAQLQIMDGGINNIALMLDRLKTLAMQSASGSFTGSRVTLNNEFQTDVAEIDRQAKSIGLNAGGLFAKSLGVYLGAGSGSGTDATNSVVTMDLSNATVDSAALGLRGMAATSKSGFDLSAAEITSITTDGTNQTAIAGNAYQTDFKFSGAGFDALDVKVAIGSGGVSSVATLVANINQALTTAGQNNTAFQAAGITAGITPDATSGKQVLTFTSASGAFQVRAGDLMANALLGNLNGAGPTGATLTSTVTGQTFNAGASVFTAGQQITYIISGGGLAAPQAFMLTALGTDTGTTMAAKVVADVLTHQTLVNAGITANTSGGSLTFSSATGQALKVSIAGDTNGVAATTNLLGYGSFQGTAGAVPSSQITAGQVFNKGVGDGGGYLDLSVNGAAAAHLVLAIDATNDTVNTVATKINNAIAGRSDEWAKAGIVASVSGGNKLVLTSTNGTNFLVASSNAGAGATNNLGFNGLAGAGSDNTVTAYPGVLTAPVPNFIAANSGGDYQLANAGGTAATPVTFAGITFGDTQQVTISAADASGTNHTVAAQLSITNAWSIDAAITAINAAIQTEPALAGIAAVKANVTGTEQIQFISPASFQVAIAATTNGTGLNAGVGATLGSIQTAGGGALDISTATSAQAAVTAISAAVTALGASQAAVGKSQNMLGYAISLAQSQITNFSAAESYIRDANVAQQAANLTKSAVLQQASIAAMAQANAAPQAVLALLRG